MKGVKIELSSDIIPNAGLGSSASTSIALISAVSEFYDLNLQKADVLTYVLEMEKISHGNPSGIDHTTCLYGNIIYYQKGSPFHIIYPPDDFQVLITYTNEVHNTKEVVTNVKKLKEEKSYLFDSIVDKIGFYTEIAELELISGNYEEVGKLMNFNQDLLSQLDVSNETINKINEIAIKNGAYGSKLTGAGLGGCVITLGEEKVLKKISKIFKSQGYWNLITTQDKNGAITAK
jgi:mevalonate kinase